MYSHSIKNGVTISSKIKQICRVGETLWDELGENFDYTIKTHSGNADIKEQILRVSMSTVENDSSVIKRQLPINSDSIRSTRDTLRDYNNKLYSNIKDIANNNFNCIGYFDYCNFISTNVRYLLSNEDGSLEIKRAFGIAAVGLFLTPTVKNRPINPYFVSTYIQMYLLVRNGVIDKAIKNNFNIEKGFEALNKDMFFEDMMDWVAQYSNGANVVKQYVISRYIKQNDMSSLRKFYKALATDIEENQAEYGVAGVELPESITGSNTYEKLVKKPGFEALLKYTYKSFRQDGEVYTMGYMASMCQAFNLKAEHAYISAAMTDSLEGLNYEMQKLNEFVEAQSQAIEYAGSEIERYKKESNDRRSQYKKQRSMTKELTKQLDELKKRLAKRENDSKRQQEIIDELRDQGRTSTRPYEEELNRLRDEIKRARGTIETLERESARLKKDKNELNTKVRTLEAKVSESYESIERVRKKAHEVANNTNIPIEAYIKALKDVRILIVGGDSMHQYIQTVGLTNVKFIKTSNHGTPESDIANSDIVVIVTPHVSHVTSIKPKNVAVRCNIPILYYNNTNVNGLIIEIFKAYFMKGLE